MTPCRFLRAGLALALVTLVAAPVAVAADGGPRPGSFAPRAASASVRASAGPRPGSFAPRAASASVRGSAGPVLYVGDSLGVGTLPQLGARLPNVMFAGDTRVGRNSTDAVAVLHARLRRGHRIVIFDVGTNDWSAATLAANLRRAHAEVGSRRLIVFTINRSGAGPLNRAIRAFAAGTLRVGLVDWHATARRERLLGGDGIHASSAGYGRRAALIAARLEGR